MNLVSFSFYCFFLVFTLRGIYDDFVIRGIYDDFILRGIYDDFVLRGIYNDFVLRGIYDDFRLRGFNGGRFFYFLFHRYISSLSYESFTRPAS